MPLQTPNHISKLKKTLLYLNDLHSSYIIVVALKLGEYYYFVHFNEIQHNTIYFKTHMNITDLQTSHGIYAKHDTYNYKIFIAS